MADGDDFELDEHGIYRDKQEGRQGSGDQGKQYDNKCFIKVGQLKEIYHQVLIACSCLRYHMLCQYL